MTRKAIVMAEKKTKKPNIDEKELVRDYANLNLPDAGEIDITEFVDGKEPYPDEFLDENGSLKTDQKEDAK